MALLLARSRSWEPGVSHRVLELKHSELTLTLGLCWRAAGPGLASPTGVHTL